MLKRLLLGAMLITLAPLSSYAQVQQGGIAPSAAGKSLAVTNVSGCVAMTQQNNSIVVWNVGANAAYYNINGATATTGNPQLPAGAAIALSVPPGASFCAITASSTTTLQITQGFGNPSLAWIPLSVTATIDTTGLATSANQTSQITQETAINTILGTVTASPTANTISDRLKTIAAGIPVTNAGTFATQSAVTAASGAFASGSFASGSHAAGSFASGAFASGSVASGALASGSIASGAMVDLVALSAPVAPATATATKSALIGCQATSAGITPTTGQQAAIDCDLNNNLLVSPGGAPNLSISQVSVGTSDTSVVAARALRRAVTIQQITGTQNVFCNQTTATSANGVVLPAVVGASITLNTTSAVRCIAITGAQTVAIAETF